jgi:NADH dehydrogenase (ubiquinone) Fe-S protein 5
MASGVGVNGGRGRCYSLWMDFTRCLADADLPCDCQDFRDDYIECLHHRKEMHRARLISEAAKKKEASDAAAKRRDADIAGSANPTS